MDEYISGDEARIYLHISKRKMKYLIENSYIPSRDTGKKTHKYLLLSADVRAFRIRMKKHPESLAELCGKFSNRPKKRPIEPTEANCRALCAFLTRQWSNEPDALTTAAVAALVGVSPGQIGRLCAGGKIQSVVVGSVRYCSKESAIGHFSSAAVIAAVKPGTVPEYINRFMKET